MSQPGTAINTVSNNAYDPSKRCKISLLSFHKKFLCCESNLTNLRVVCNRTKSGKWEEFISIPIPNEKDIICLQSTHKTYLSVTKTGALKATKKQFTASNFKIIYDQDSNKYGLISQRTSGHLSAQKNGTLKCDKSWFRNYEKFTIKVIEILNDPNININAILDDQKEGIIANANDQKSLYSLIDKLQKENKGYISQITELQNNRNHNLAKMSEYSRENTLLRKSIIMYKEREIKLIEENENFIKQINKLKQQISAQKDDNASNVSLLVNKRGRGKRRGRGRGRGRFGDWKCSGCSMSNFSSRDRCRNCDMGRDGGFQSFAYKARNIMVNVDKNGKIIGLSDKINNASKPKNKIKNKNEWICSDCSTSNFSSRDKCRKCKKSQ